MQLTAQRSPKPTDERWPSSSFLTWNGNISFSLFPLGIGEEHDGLGTVSGPEDAQVLTDTFFATSFRFGFCYAGHKDYLTSKQGFLKTHTICGIILGISGGRGLVTAETLTIPILKRVRGL
jgi:hypothetical protein